MTSDHLALLADVRIPGDARLMAFLLLQMGQGWHEVAHDAFRSILSDGPSDDTIRRHLRRLEGAGWVESDTVTGRRSPKYRIRAPNETPAGKLRAAFAESLALTVAGLSAMPSTPAGETNLSPAPERAIDPLAQHRSGAKATVVVEERDVVEEGESAGARDDTHPLSPKAEETLEQYSETLNGCRGSFRDYLTARVPTDQQYGFIQTCAGWLNGLDPSVFRMPGGAAAPADERTKILATALNELLATNEKGMKRPEGDPGNLKTKINVLLQQRGDRGRDTGRTQGKAGGGEAKVSSIAGDRESRRRGGPT